MGKRKWTRKLAYRSLGRASLTGRKPPVPSGLPVAYAART
jgi:hypothetical protein